MKISKSAPSKDELEYHQDQHIPHLMNRAAAAMYSKFAAQFPRHMTVPMWRVLAMLYERGEQRQVDISRLTFMEPSSISRMITGLVRQGLVSRARSQTSNREVTVKLTPKGRTTVTGFIPVTSQHEDLMTKGLSRTDLVVLRRCLTQIHLNMQLVEDMDEKRARGKSPLG
jgi:MarR family transcriptional regulator, organic hydroperoxide resistance regulator